MEEKNLGEIFADLLQKDAGRNSDGEVINGAEAMAIKAFNQAIKGDWKAWELVKESLGQAKTKNEFSLILEKNQLKTREEREKKEVRKLSKLYKNIPDNQKKLLAGLIQQAARHKIMLDDLWEDLLLNGSIETFEQGRDSFERERPNSKLFKEHDRAYQAIIKQLNDLLPAEATGGMLEKILNDD